MRLLFATHNANKLAEARQILGAKGIEIDHLDMEYEEPRGEDTSEIAEKSARGLFSGIRKPLFLEDAGLFIEALNGFPGPYSAWVFRKMGYQGILDLLKGKGSRRAHFKSSVAYADDNGVRVFEGKVEGSIAMQAGGESGFGYDPVFVPDGYGETFAEMDRAIKNSISHRKMALEKLAGHLLSPS